MARSISNPLLNTACLVIGSIPNCLYFSTIKSTCSSSTPLSIRKPQKVIAIRLERLLKKTLSPKQSYKKIPTFPSYTSDHLFITL